MTEMSSDQDFASNAISKDQDPSADLDAPNEFEASLEADINPGGADPTAMNVDSDAAVNGTSQEKDIPALGESRIAAKKDATLREFLSKMDDYSPIIPDAVTNYYLTLAGLPPPPQTPVHLARLLALATQKFIADIAADAYQYSRIRSTNTTSNNPLTGLGGAAGFGTTGGAGGPSGAGGGQDDGRKGKEGAAGKGAPLGGPRPGFGSGAAGGGAGRTVLTMEDLGMAVGEYGVNVKRGEFYR